MVFLFVAHNSFALFFLGDESAESQNSQILKMEFKIVAGLLMFFGPQPQ